MRKKIFIVEDHFKIKGRGLVITSKRENTNSYKVGDSLTIVRPDEREIKTILSGIEMLKPPNFKNEAISVLNLKKRRCADWFGSFYRNREINYSKNFDYINKWFHIELLQVK